MSGRNRVLKLGNPLAIGAHIDLVTVGSIPGGMVKRCHALLNSSMELAST
jgi:hypothetical protein